MYKRHIKTVYQPDSKDCGPTCLHVIARFYGKTYSIQHLRELCFITREGVSMLGICHAADSIGFDTLCVKISMSQLEQEMPLPCILFWNHNHFVVCYKIKKCKRSTMFRLMDPSKGKVWCSEKDLKQYWICENSAEFYGIAIQITPTSKFYSYSDKDEKSSRKDITYFLKFILPFKKTYLHIIAGTLVTMMLGYCIPFLSQATIDIGIKYKNLDFILIVMFVQLGISFSQILIQFLQSWISLHMHTIIDMNMIENYLTKLTNMPMKFFDIKTFGDIIQRIGDHAKIKEFLMGNVVNTFFSIGTLIMFTIILAIYNLKILCIFCVGNILYITWISCFLDYRRRINHKSFSLSAKMQNNTMQFIKGMTDIKLNGMEQTMIREWEKIQTDLYKINMQSLKIGQIQSSGSLTISTITNFIVAYLTAKLVVAGEMTLGMMMAQSFILGQISGPIASFLELICSYQDSKMSMERLGDINNQDDELTGDENKDAYLPANNDISFENVSFSYDGSSSHCILNGIS